MDPSGFAFGCLELEEVVNGPNQCVTASFEATRIMKD
jgi:hypothetical protein